MKTSDLINQLAAKSKPVQVVPATSRRLMIWAGLGILMVVSGLMMMGIRPDLSVVAIHPHYYLECAALFGLAVWGALWALRFSIPGNEPASKFTIFPFMLGLVWVGLIFFRMIQESLGLFQIQFDGHYPCGLAVLGMSLIPNIVLSRMASRSYPLRQGLVGFLIGSASGAVGALAMQLICPQNHPTHVLVWHGIPILFSGVLGWLFSKMMVLSPEK